MVIHILTGLPFRNQIENIIVFDITEDAIAQTSLEKDPFGFSRQAVFFINILLTT